jgi:hypothetical protein
MSATNTLEYILAIDGFAITLSMLGIILAIRSLKR